MTWGSPALSVVAALTLLGAALLALLLRRRPQPRARAAPLEQDHARMAARLQALELRYQEQLEFSVNFPEVVRSLTAALTVDQVLSASSRGITALMRTRQLAFLMVEDAQHLLLVDGAGFPNELRGQLRLSVDAGLALILAQYGVTMLADHPRAASAIHAAGLPAEIAVPMQQGEQTLGLLLVARAQGEPQTVRRLLAMMADLTAVGFNAARQVSQIRQQAERDGLTGLANRTVLMTRMNRELRRCASYQSRTSLAMIDVDHFKVYNDQNGHAAGDEALRMVAQLIGATTRRTDLVARYGGEEFTVVLTGADREQALQHAERLRRIVADQDFPNGAGQPLGRVSISIGVATFPDDADNVASLFEAADKALYRAKHQGRNRVVAFSPHAEEVTPPPGPVTGIKRTASDGG